MNTNAVQTKKPQQIDIHPIDKMDQDLNAWKGEFENILPPTTKFEFFKGIIFLSIRKNPDLLMADRSSFITACLDAAHDGLLPDGREGAMVIFSTKVKRDGKDAWIKKVQFIAMIAGVRKLVRASGELLDWQSVVVHAKDTFHYERGLEPKLIHKPYQGEDDPGGLVAVYSIAKLLNGEISFEVMNLFQINKVRNTSKTKDSGPWVDHFDEMARKTVCKRHRKELPISTKLEAILMREDVLHDEGVDTATDEKPERPTMKKPEQLPAPTGRDVDMTPTTEVTEQEGEKVENKTEKEPAANKKQAEPAKTEAKTEAKDPPHDANTGEVKDTAYAKKRGRSDADAGKEQKNMPPEFATPDAEALGDAWVEGLLERYSEIEFTKKNSGQKQT